MDNKNITKHYNADDSDDTYDSDDSDKQRKKIPVTTRLKEIIRQKQLERKKGTKKEKENYDE